MGIFDVAVSEEAGGAGGSVADLCAMVEEAARALVPGPVATTALATLVVTDPVLLEDFSTGRRTAGTVLDAELSEESGRVSGSVDYVLGAEADGVLLLPVGDRMMLVDVTRTGSWSRRCRRRISPGP